MFSIRAIARAAAAVLSRPLRSLISGRAALVLAAMLSIPAVLTPAEALTCSGFASRSIGSNGYAGVTADVGAGTCVRATAFNASATGTGHLIEVAFQYSGTQGDLIARVKDSAGTALPTSSYSWSSNTAWTAIDDHTDHWHPQLTPFPQSDYTGTLTWSNGGTTYQLTLVYGRNGSDYYIQSATVTGGVFNAPAPTLSAISLSAGPLIGGQTVTLTGSNLTGATAVTIGGTAATSITVVNDTTVTAVTPAGTAGAKNVVITTPGGNATLTNGYTYVAAPSLSALSPDKGLHTGGNVVTFTGTNLSGATAVTFNGVPATSFTVNSATSITATAPPGATGVRSATVTTPGGSASRFYQYEAIVTSVTPSSGSTDGGTFITLTGSGFTDVTGVVVATPDFLSLADATSVTVVNDTTITAITPAMSAGSRVIVLRVPWQPNFGFTQITSVPFTHVAAPTLSAISPDTGLVAGGQTVTLTGTNLTGATAVTIGGVAATGFTVNSATQITATTPAGTAGAKDVVVTTAGGNATLTNGYTYVAAPTLASISPSSGILIGGQTVTLTGTNLTGATAVTIGGTAATSVTVVNDTTVMAVTPAGTAGARDVVITTPGGNATLANGFTYAAPPTLTAVSPSSGPTAGGTTITLTGTNLTGATAVVVGGALATGVTVVNATTVTAVTPARPAGTYNVAISTPGGGTALASAYTYVAAPTLTAVSPGGGPAAGGNGITITGTNFTLGSTVTIGGAAVTSLALVNATTLAGIAPAGAAGAKDVVVTTPGGSATLTNGYIHLAAPTLAAVSPNRGPVEGGQVVTLSGTNFTGATSVTIDAVPVNSFTVVNDTTISLVTAARGQGPKSVAVATPGGSISLLGAYTYVVAPQIVSLTTTGFTAGGDTITITGTGFTGATAVTFNGVPAPSSNVISPTEIQAISPPGSVGYVPVRVISEFGIESPAANFLYRPKVLAIAPSAGPTSGGQVLTITGEGFTGLTGVKLGNTELSSFTVVNDTTITAVTPPLGAGNWPVWVLSGGLQFSGTPSQVVYTVQNGPTLSAVSPNAGPTAGAQTITLTGTNLTGASAVTIDGIPATSIAVVSATTITADTPPGTAGVKGVSVTTPGGTFALPGGYTYVAAPTLTAVSPNAGSPVGGQSVTLAGTNLTGASAVTFDGAAASFTVVNDTTITAITPAGSAGPADVAVTTSGGTATLNAGYTYGVPLLALTAGDLAISGNEGGANWATISSTTAYTVENAGSDTLTWSATLPVFLSATPLTGTLQPGETAPLAPTPNAAANALSPGVYTGAITVTSNGGTETRNVTLIVGDATAPVLATGPANITVDTSPGATTAIVTYTAPTFTDNVGVTSVTQIAGLPSGAAFPIGITTNTFRASDAAANTTDYSFTVTVGDNQAPVLANGPANITVNTAPGSDSAVVTYAVPTFTDNVGVTSVTQIAGLPSGAAFPVGITTNTFRAADAASNTTDYSFTVTVADAEPPVLVNVPANITISVDFPATSAVATWTPPTATDNAPGVSVTRTAGPAPGSTFPLGATTITYRAADTAGNTADASFTVTVNQIAQGTLTLNVETGEDGTFNFTSTAPGATTSVTTSGGTGTTGPIGIPAGSYSLSFTVPQGFAVTSATCTGGSTLSTASQSGTITIAPATSTLCTISAEDSLGETAAALGTHLETRASLILQNAPEMARRLDRLTGTGGGSGGISGFGVTMGAGVLPFSMNLAADEMRFSMSLLGASRAEAGRLMPSRPARLAGGMADPLGDSLFGMAADRMMGRETIPVEEPGFGAATGGTLPGDPMARRFDVWVEGRFARFDTPGGDGQFAIIHVGADYLLTPGVLIGAAIQFDWLEEDTALGGTVDSQGFLAGPYLTARLSENLFLDVRAAWGTADADVSPYGTYVDGVESSRQLFTGALIGDFEDGAMRIRPEARVTWYREETDAYVDGFGVPIPGFTVETGYFEFGPEFAYAVALRDGASILPSLSFQGVWTFAQENTAAVPSNAPGLAETGLRGRVEIGLAYAEPGFSVAAATYYDGIGGTDFEAWGARIKLSLGF